jgi:RNA polymerase sigma-70 factor (ECF subfamily)
VRFDPLNNPEPLIRRVYAYAAYRLGDGPDAEDATSDTFERALRYQTSYDRRKGEPVAWLLGIARRCVDDVYSARPVLADPDSERDSSEDHAAAAIRRMTVRRAVATLDERSQEIVALRYGADLTARQIAELLGERTNTVEVALHRALGRLQKQLGDDRPRPGPKRASGEEGVRI